MSALFALVLMFAGASPVVEVTTLQGEPRTGEWRGLSETSINLIQAGQEAAVPLGEVLEIRFRRDATAKFEKPAVVVSLWDGSALSGSQITSILLFPHHGFCPTQY